MLPDLLTPDLDVVFCGTAASTTSAAAGHYYRHPSNRFWHLLHDAGFTPALLRPEQDGDLPGLGLGLTDLEKALAQSHDRGLTFEQAGATTTALAAAAPAWVGFNGLTAARAAARSLGEPRVRDLGEQGWHIGRSRVFVLPSSSATSARMLYAQKVRWWERLRVLAR